MPLPVFGHAKLSPPAGFKLFSVPARLSSSHQGSDIAVIKAGVQFAKPARFRSATAGRPGESIVITGFPLPALLSSTLNVTTDTLSARLGVSDDRRFVQITAPVQPRNSGGPLLDRAGNIIGVVVAKLKFLKFARRTGDISQNVNFAVSLRALKAYFDINNIRYLSSAATTALDPADVAAMARDFTVRVECRK